LPQNAWAWMGRMPKDPEWIAKKAAFRITGDLSIARARGVIRLSESVPAGKSPSIVLPNVLSDEFDDLAKLVVKTSKPSRKPYVYSFGNFIDYRNYDKLIEGFLQSGETRTLLIHGGVLSRSYLRRCESLVGEHNASVELDSERKSRIEILRHIYWSDGVIFPSTAEASPISLLETLALGKAVICNDIPGHSQSLKMATALASAIDIGSSEKLAAALAELSGGEATGSMDPIGSVAYRVREDAREHWLEDLKVFVARLG